MYTTCIQLGFSQQPVSEVRRDCTDTAAVCRFAQCTTIYQSFETQLQATGAFGHYDYIVGDEAHYFFDDSFNQQTDISGKYLVNSAVKDSVIILMSATGSLIFPTLIQNGYARKERYYTIPGNYDFVNHVFLYQKKYAENIISKILNETDDKILFFCNNLARLGQMYKIFGEQAYYCCSKARRKSSVIPASVLRKGDGCIRKGNEGTITFDKRILFTTTVLDNGVDIKDLSLKHIFSEVFDFNALIQSLGRKRSLSENDCCCYYIMYHEREGVASVKRRTDAQLSMIDCYERNYRHFHTLIEHNRRFMSNHHAFYLGKPINHHGQMTDIHVNTMYSYKLTTTAQMCAMMLERGYDSCLKDVIADTMQKKVDIYDVGKDLKREFRLLLASLVDVKLFADSDWYRELRQLFLDLKVNPSKTASLNKINEYLQVQKSPYLLESHKCRDRGKYRDKTYWIVKRAAATNPET